MFLIGCLRNKTERLSLTPLIVGKNLVSFTVGKIEMNLSVTLSARQFNPLACAEVIIYRIPTFSFDFIHNYAPTSPLPPKKLSR